MTPKRPPAPSHLSARSRTFWRRIHAEYELEVHQTEILRRLCEVIDRCDAARERLDAEGVVVLDRFDQLKTHPAVAIERDARLAIARLTRELNLDTEPPDDSRPVTLAYSRGRKAGR